MVKKDLIIIVPGAIVVKKEPNFIKFIASVIHKVIRYDHVEKEPFINWNGKIGRKKDKVIWFKWKRTIDLNSLYEGIKKLKALIKRSHNYNIKLVGISFGGELILRALYGANFKNVKKIILVGSSHEIMKLDNYPPLINIYSLRDRLNKMGIEILSFGKKRSPRLKGKKVRNIVLPGMTHNLFCLNKRIKKGKFKNKRPTEIVNLLLKA